MTGKSAAPKAAPPRAFRYVEIASMLTCIALDLRLARDLALGFARDAPDPVFVLLHVVVAYLACDLVAGLVHFVLDRFGTVDTPYVGRTFLLPFRSHHDEPEAIRTHDFVETNGNNAFGALLVLVPFVALRDVREGGDEALAGVFVLVFTVSVLLTNQIHKWAHLDAPPRVVRLLQRAGILLSPEIHAAHHSLPHGGGYCVTSGLFNRLLDPIGFFPACERTIRTLLRIPRSDEPR